MAKYSHQRTALSEETDHVYCLLAETHGTSISTEFQIIQKSSLSCLDCLFVWLFLILFFYTLTAENLCQKEQVHHKRESK